MQRIILILVLPLLLLTSYSVIIAQTPTFEPQPYIYRIKVEGCNYAPKVRRQTGFLVRGEGGIVTALHGVADCPDAMIAAESAHGDFAALTIQAVDIDRDVALLSSSELAARVDDGLEAPFIDSVTLTGLHALGYPYGKTDQEPTTQISVTYAMTLNQVIPGEFITPAFEKRRSPDLGIRVLFTEAHFVPGHSGAPVLNAQKQVIGVVSGGLKEGYIGKSWLIPWADIQWQPLYDTTGALNPALKARWALVQENDPELSLSFLSTYPDLSITKGEIKTYRGTILDTNQQPIPGASVTLSFEDTYLIDLTDDRGSYRFDLVPEAVDKFREILVEKEGYKTVTLDSFVPEKIPLKVVTLPIPIAIEIGDYLRVIWPLDLSLRQSPTNSSPRITGLSQGRLLKVIGLPQQQQERIWWKVQLVGENNQVGWVEASSDTNVYVERLPFFIQGDIVQMTAKERRRLRQTPSVNGAIIGALEPGAESKISNGPEEADGYLWYELQGFDGKIIGWVAAAGDEGVYLEQTTQPSVVKSTPQLTPTPISRPTDLVFEQVIGKVTYKLVEVRQEGNGIKVWVVAKNEGVSTQSAICSYANGNVGFCRLLDDVGNSYDGNYKGWGWTSVILPSNASFRFEISFPARGLTNISLLEIPVSGGLIEFHSVPIPYKAAESTVEMPLAPEISTQKFEQEIGKVTYKLIEIKQESSGIRVSMIAQNEGVSTQSAICSYANGNIGYCRLFDDEGNFYDGSHNERVWSSVILPSSAPFRFEVNFPVRDIANVALLEIPVTGGLIEFYNVPVPYEVPISQQMPTPVTDNINQTFEQTIGHVNYKVVEVKQEGSNVKVWAVAKNEGVSLQSAICSYANGNVGFCRFFDDAGNSYDGVYNERVWNHATLPGNAPFRFEISFPTRGVTNMSVLEIPVSGGLIEFHNVPIPYKAPE